MFQFLLPKHPVLVQKISRKIGEGKQKKVLSLVLCVAMMLSVMVVGAGHIRFLKVVRNQNV